MIANNIDEAIQLMEEVIDSSRAGKSRLGYFAALYHRVTTTVKHGIDTGFFDNGDRMAKFDVVFANRYLEALTAYEEGKPCSSSWQLAFEAAETDQPIVLQHLLLGMNAHINLDLGIAAATICPGTEISTLEGDFNKINMVLSSLVGECVTEFDLVEIALQCADFS